MTLSCLENLEKFAGFGSLSLGMNPEQRQNKVGRVKPTGPYPFIPSLSAA
jgi:hypothetical protein